uniref:Uncharacterized protein n=1 Tax=Oryza brachyantha TaxID=4533 RepID=J3MKF2_ORYBR
MVAVRSSCVLLLNEAAQQCMVPLPLYLWEFDPVDNLLADNLDTALFSLSYDISGFEL